MRKPFNILLKGDQTQLLQKQVIQSSKSNTSSITIEVDAQKTFQTMEGFGFALTGGICWFNGCITC